MPILSFSGRIIPSAFPFSVSNYPPVDIMEKDGTRLATLKLTAEYNHFIAKVEVTRPITKELENMAMKWPRDVLDAVTSLTSFGSGICFSFVAERIYDEDGTSHEVAAEEPNLPQFATAIRSDQGFAKAVNLVPSDMNLSLALRDLATSLGTIHTIPTNCARAVDSIRHHFVPVGGEAKEGWQPMQQALNISEGFLKHITDASKGPRHGDWTNVQQDLRPIQEAAWQVMNRFLEYRMRGNQPLPLSDFPLLVV